jgi:hypothetical protein
MGGEMIDFREHPGFQLLAELGLPRGDFAVAGSAALFVRGVIHEIGDVDVIARGEAWTRVAALGTVTLAPLYPVHRVVLHEGRLEILDGWFPELWDIDELIDRADVIRGFRAVRLEVIARTKAMLLRPRDETHLGLLARSPLAD